MVEWFELNILLLNLEEKKHKEIFTLNSPLYALTTGHKDTYVKETVNTKFLALQHESHPNCKDHIQQMIPILSEASYTF
jgi:hypothetical protein